MDQNTATKPTTRRSPGVIVVGIFAVIAGLGEVVVGFTVNYLGILDHSMAPSFSTGVVGVLYCLGGFFLLVTRKKWGAFLGISFIGAEILGRVVLVGTGIAPGTGFDALKILLGGLIAFGLIIYIFCKWKSFD